MWFLAPCNSACNALLSTDTGFFFSFANGTHKACSCKTDMSGQSVNVSSIYELSAVASYVPLTVDPRLR